MSSPEFRVARSSFDDRFDQETFVSIVNRIMRVVSNTNQELRIENVINAVDNFIN